ncbi:MAG TPA: hypothetical protein VFV80_06805, partial [Geminicoccaceae bacterium]|nr:hypothetical protein [Geminicoccaceae bacterium]
MTSKTTARLCAGPARDIGSIAAPLFAAGAATDLDHKHASDRTSADLSGPFALPRNRDRLASASAEPRPQHGD